MMINNTSPEFNAMWEAGFRPYEIYVFNETVVTYMGKPAAAGTVSGWEIKHVFAKRSELKSFPFFDVVIGYSDMSTVTEIHKETKGEQQ